MVVAALVQVAQAAAHAAAHVAVAAAAEAVVADPRRLDSVRAQGTAADDHDFGASALSHRPVKVQIRPAREQRHVGDRAIAQHGEDGR